MTKLKILSAKRKTCLVNLNSKIDKLREDRDIQYLENLLQSLDDIRKKHEELCDELMEEENINHEELDEARTTFDTQYDEGECKIKKILHSKICASEIQLLEWKFESLDVFNAIIEAHIEDSPVHFDDQMKNLKQTFQEFSKVLKSVFNYATAEEKITCKELDKKFNLKYQELSNWFQIKSRSDEAIQQNNSIRTVETISNPIGAPRVKFPVLELPKFDGQPDKWIPFRDAFKSTVNDRQDISGAIKFRYLKTAVTDKMSPIAHLIETEDGYEAAWEMLLNYYDDKRKIVNHHISAILSIKKMSSETAEELQKLLNEFVNHSSSLSRICSKEELADVIIAHLASFRLDNHTRDLWETENGDNIPKWPQMQIFLEKRRKTLNAIPKIKSSDSSFSQPRAWVKAANIHVMNSSPKIFKCKLCNGDHKLHQCQIFLSLSIAQREAKVKELKICKNCFRNCTSQCLSKYRCQTCHQQHHTTLHREMKPTAAAYNRSMVTSCSATSDSTTYLSTAVIKIKNSHGKWVTVRALLDSGSDANCITRNAALALKLPIQPAAISMNGFGENPQEINGTVSTTISAREGWYSKTLEFLVTKKITGMLPSHPLEKPKFSLPEGDVLADPNFNLPAQIDLLIGNELYLQLLKNDRIELPNGPLLQDTAFGWIIAGKAKLKPPTPSRHCNLIRQMDLKETIEKFYNDEDYRNRKGFMTEEEQYCEQLFEQTHKRDADGRFIIQIPLKENINQLVSNRNIAMCQFLANEKRLLKNERLRDETIKFMREYHELQHMTEVPNPPEDSNVYYLPHHAVEKPDSTTTKVRVVFNASSKSKAGLSFNDVQCIGPQIQSDAFSLGLKFRQHNIIIKADIAKMYRQVQVVPEQRKFQLILWREGPHEPIKTYELNTVTYGTASASFQSTRCLKQLAIEYKDKSPEAAKEIEESFYVDDLMSGAETVIKANNLFTKIDDIISSGAMKLRKVCSNSTEFLASIPEEDREKPSTDMTMKALGIKWNPNKDEIEFEIHPIQHQRVTKRIALAEISKIYDPEGLLGPVIFKFKAFMKSIHLLKGTWDEPLPENETNEWNQLAQTFAQLKQIRVPRQVTLTNFINLQMHGFSDASDNGYGAAIYIRTEDQFGNVLVNLLCAKSRLAPNNRTSTARLELCGAVIMIHLMNRVEEALITKPHQKICWMDSAIAIHWLKRSPKQLQPYVANRVSEIQELSKDVQWKHIKGELNPADLISRGLLPEELINNSKWWCGPEFLKLPEDEWPPSIVSINPEDPLYTSEFKKVNVLHCTTAEPNQFITMIENSSNIFVVKWKIARIMRCIFNMRANKLKVPKRKGPLNVDDLHDAEIAMCRMYQVEYFKKEFQQLNAKREISTNSQILSLNPYWDSKDNIIRVGGRLNFAKHLPYHQKHPIILPKGHLSSLIIRETHQKNLHAGQQATMGFLKMKYWPLGAKSSINKEIHKCVKCFRARPQMIQQFMGQLPQARVTPAPVFYNTGVDYAGPIDIKFGYSRNAPTKKCYIALFICLSTKAIHIEVVSELTTKAFLATLDRFSARRGLPAHLHSDHGTNFVGAKNELQELSSFLQRTATQDEIRMHLLKQEIHWHFIPPRAPHHGGLWEAGVKSMKYHLKRVTSQGRFHYEELCTITCRIEAILNSRPLMPASDDPNDLEVLTAGHFLIGRPLIAPPQRNQLNASPSCLERWDRVTLAQQHIWKRWSQEYLHHLQNRSKNYKKIVPVQEGNLVLLESENQPPMTWPLGRIIEIAPGKDEISRVARVKTLSSTLDRPVVKLAILPIDDNDQKKLAENVNQN